MNLKQLSITMLNGILNPLGWECFLMISGTFAIYPVHPEQGMPGAGIECWELDINTMAISKRVTKWGDTNGPWITLGSIKKLYDFFKEMPAYGNPVYQEE